ncbi:unnamed protein product [Prunus armeniaca]|uniref:CAAX prenyl protease 2/Lysostaphin resistance protein A-like domain-containing protein n=1 Tax=Prunus armeniaca TaxID=36596 RepID=A0A6J5TQ74_PRUAR|nr:unnamed protein product [Prunus armeniaca]
MNSEWRTLYLQFCILLPALSNRYLKTFIAMRLVLWCNSYIAVTGAAASLFKGESLEREEDALVSLFPLIGSSSVRHFTSTACLLGVTGVLAPILEETKFKLVCWKVEAGLTSNLPPRVPTPVAIGISAVVFALAHLTPEEFPSCSAVGLSYAQTHNLLTPITIDALWNSGVILLLTFLHINMMMSEY